MHLLGCWMNAGGRSRTPLDQQHALPLPTAAHTPSMPVSDDSFAVDGGSVAGAGKVNIQVIDNSPPGECSTSDTKEPASAGEPPQPPARLAALATPFDLPAQAPQSVDIVPPRPTPVPPVADEPDTRCVCLCVGMWI